MKRLFILCLLIMLLACGTDPVPASPSPANDAALITQPPHETPAPDAGTPDPDPTAEPQPTATPDPTEEPISTPEPTPTPDPRFTFVWTSDTQTMIVLPFMRDNYLAVCDWIAKEADARNFVLFLHTGDMVDDGDDGGQWKLFLEGVDAFRDRIPFVWALGNHDEGTHRLQPWREHIYPDDVPPEQVFQDGVAWYRIFEKDETRLLLLSIQYRLSRTDPVLEWTREVCLSHPDLPVLLLTHEYLTAEGDVANRADVLESQIVAACPNIRLILCGHSRGISQGVFRYDDDGDGVPERTVNALMYDIQTDFDRYGYLCLLTYDPRDNSLTVDSYSPLWDDHVYDDEHPELEQFVLHDVF